MITRYVRALVGASFYVRMSVDVSRLRNIEREGTMRDRERKRKTIIATRKDKANIDSVNKAQLLFHSVLSLEFNAPSARKVCVRS